MRRASITFSAADAASLAASFDLHLPVSGALDSDHPHSSNGASLNHSRRGGASEAGALLREEPSSAYSLRNSRLCALRASSRASWAVLQGQVRRGRSPPPPLPHAISSPDFRRAVPDSAMGTVARQEAGGGLWPCARRRTVGRPLGRPWTRLRSRTKAGRTLRDAPQGRQ